MGSEAGIDEVSELLRMSRGELVERTAHALARLGDELDVSDPDGRLELLAAIMALPSEHRL